MVRDLDFRKELTMYERVEDFEILSEETWRKDVEEKPDLYARLGVHEYFAYDPNPSPAPRTIWLPGPM